MEKQNICPVCRQEVTAANLKQQKKELEKLLKSIKRESKESIDELKQKLIWSSIIFDTFF